MSQFIFTKFNIVLEMNFKTLQDKTFYIIALHYIYVMQIIQSRHERTLCFQYDTEQTQHLQTFTLTSMNTKTLEVLMVAITHLTCCVPGPLDTTMHVTRKGIFTKARVLVGLPCLMQIRARFGLPSNAGHKYQFDEQQVSATKKKLSKISCTNIYL